MRRAGLLAGLALAACGPGAMAPPPQAGQASQASEAQRVVSLDYCADQYVLQLLPRARILAVSGEADEAFSYLRAFAVGIPSVRPTAEDVLMLKPDLIVRSFGGGPNAAAYFERAGIPVVQVGWASDIEGVKRVTRQVAAELGESTAGEALVSEMEARLARLPAPARPVDALYMTSGGVSSGSGTLVGDMLAIAGLANVIDRPGWQELPLERFVAQRPGLVAYAAFKSHRTPWSSARHPVARRLLQEVETIPIEGAWTSCGSWYLVDAIEALAEAAR